MIKPDFVPARNELIASAVAYIRLRDSLNTHRSPEGKRLNAAVKAYLQAV